VDSENCRLLFRRIRDNVNGDQHIELSVFVILSIPFILLGFWVFRHPQLAEKLAEKAWFVAAVAALVGGLGWAGRSALKNFRQYTQLIAHEILSDTLSDGHPRSRQEIVRLLRTRSLIFRFIPAPAAEVLPGLVREGRLVIKNGRYMVPQVSTDGTTQKGKRKT